MRNNKKEYPVNKLYIGYLGIYNLGYIKQEEIVIVRKKLKKYINIFNGRKYINVNEVAWKSECYGKMVICKLLPLEQGFKTNLAKTISEEELIVAYNVWNKKEKINNNL